MYVRSLNMFGWILWIFDIIIPRFIKEEVAFIEVGVDEVMPLCALADVEEDDDSIVAVGTMKSFNLFGMALWPKLVGELREYEPTGEMDDVDSSES